MSSDPEALLKASKQLLNRVHDYMINNEGPGTPPLKHTFTHQLTSSPVPGYPNSIPMASVEENVDQKQMDRINDLFMQRMKNLESRLGTADSKSLLQNLEGAEKPDGQAGETMAPEEEPQEELKPLLGMVPVYTGISFEPRHELLTEAHVTHPFQLVNPDDAQNIDYARRNLEEEGFYIHDLPYCKKINILRIENRLYWSDRNREYFFMNSRIKVDTPQLQEIPPPFPMEPPLHDGTEYLSFSHAMRAITDEAEFSRDISIDIKSIKFLVHPFSSEEDILAEQLRSAFVAYETNKRIDRTKYYKDKIRSLREQLAARKEENFKDDQEAETKRQAEIEQLLSSINECHELYDYESAYSISLRNELVILSNKLKDIRRAAGFSSTSVKLRWQRKDFLPEVKAQMETQFKKQIHRRALEKVELEEIHGTHLDIGVVETEIMSKRNNMSLPSPGDPLWNGVLEETNPVTPLDQCPDFEKARRANIQRITTKINITIGKITESTDNIKLSNNFDSLIGHNFRYAMNRLIPTVLIDIIQSGAEPSGKIATLAIPVVIGEPSDTLTYNFTSDIQALNGRFVMGTINCSAYIVSDNNNQVIMRVQDDNTRTKKRLASDPTSFASLNKIASEVQKGDPNDPYVIQNFASVKASQEKDRLSSRFVLDAKVEAITFSAFVTSVTKYQTQLKLHRFTDSRMDFKVAVKTGDKYLEQLRQNKIVKQSIVKTHMELTDVVRETPMPTLPSILTAITERLFLFRPLKPTRTTRIASSKVEAYSKLVFHLVRATNIPQRTEMGTGPNTRGTLIYSSTNDVATNIFVRISFNGIVHDSNASSGTDPEWNQRFFFRTCKERDEVPNIYELEKKKIRIDIFDAVKFDVIEDDRETQTKHIITENRILGSLEIPIKTIWASGKVDGVIGFDSPPFRIGYSFNGKPIKLSCYFTIDPPLKFDASADEAESIESAEVKIRAERWLRSLKSNPRTVERNIACMFTSTKGATMLACRMLRAQNPPEEINPPDKNRIARFVSLIPNVSDNLVFDAAQDVWCTSQEFLKLNAGDEEEHAALLCNLFKYIGLDSYIVFGYSLEDGKCVYVLTKEAGQNYLWDPLRGRYYSTRDTSCPFYSVGTVVNETNLWANVQLYCEPWKIDWNFNNTNSWNSFFTSTFPITQFDTPQEQVLVYEPMKDGVETIKVKIERGIITSVEKLRDRQKTLWEIQFDQFCIPALDECEKAAISGVPDINEGQRITERIKSQYPSSLYRIFGTPFCLPFTSVERVIEEVKLRQTYKTEAQNVSFGLSVHVIPYPNNLKAIWVLFASLQRITPSMK